MLRIDKFKLVYMFPFTDERLKSVYMFLTNRQTADMIPIPIYDSYVDKVLCFFRDRDGFAIFRTEDLKDYLRFKSTLVDFRKVYGLEEYNLKEIDKYIWQLGKEYFPKNYGKGNQQ